MFAFFPPWEIPCKPLGGEKKKRTRVNGEASKTVVVDGDASYFDVFLFDLLTAKDCTVYQLALAISSSYSTMHTHARTHIHTDTRPYVHEISMGWCAATIQNSTQCYNK